MGFKDQLDRLGQVPNKYQEISITTYRIRVIYTDNKRVIKYDFV